MKRIILCCGLSAAGKSDWAKRLCEHFRFCDYVDLDEVRVFNWGAERSLTSAEHLFKNEIMRLEVKKQFIIQGAELVIVNAVMLTVENHQKPFLEMAAAVGAEIKAVWFTCDLATVERRLGFRKQHPSVSPSDIMDMADFERARVQFEAPALYPWVKIDTSDESPEADEQRWEQILQFLAD